ncbi:cornifelin homolog [Dendropsophus ebraccatus]|uniref:cornifelin homolog n=1 Tax=Dendropsophus ebraccatus TaxID=150705 RepID=UPI003831195E
MMQPQTVQPLAVSQSTSSNMVSPNEWSTGVCDCCDDMGICCCAFWCFPCFQCKTVSDFGECICLPIMDPGCFGYIGTSAVCPPISMAMRAAVRERYRVRGSICDDCCSLYCCFSCTWCQMAREIKKYKHPVAIVTAQTTTVMGPMPPQPYQAYPPQPYQAYPPQPNQAYPPQPNQAYPPQPHQAYPSPAY